jgi:hypothetical protein
MMNVNQPKSATLPVGADLSCAPLIYQPAASSRSIAQLQTVTDLDR